LDVDRLSGLIARRGSTGSRGDPRCQLPRPNLPADVWHSWFKISVSENFQPLLKSLNFSDFGFQFGQMTEIFSRNSSKKLKF
jgi:hypothetical protein